MRGWSLRTCWLAVLVGLVLPAAAQERPEPQHLGAYRDTLDLALPQPFILRPYLLPGSATLSANGSALDTTAYRIDHRFGRLWVDAPALDSTAMLVAVYRTWGGLQETYRRRVYHGSGSVERDTVDLLQHTTAFLGAMRQFTGRDTTSE